MFERFTGGLIGIGRIVPFTYDERETMRAVLREAGTPYGDYAGVDYYWANGLRGGPVQALFRWQEEYRVYLQPPAELDPGIKLMGGKEYMDSAIRLLAPSAVHELVHLRQLISMGRMRYWACSIPGLYYTMLDMEAFAQERAAAIALGLAQGDYGGFGDGSRR